MRRLARFHFLTVLAGFFSVASVEADVVRPSSRVTRWVNVRATPGGPQKIDILRRDASLPLVALGTAWHEVRLSDGTSGFVSADWTVIERTTAPPPPPVPPPPVQVIGGPARSDPLRVDVLTESPFSVTAALSVFVAFLSLAVALYASRHTNIRSRNETFRVLRERYETVRKDHPVDDHIWDGTIKLADTIKAVTSAVDHANGPFHTNSVETVQRQADNLVLLYKSIEPTVKCWVRAFDEWYITSGGRGVGPKADSPLSKGLHRIFGVYRVLWDEYYRDVLTKAVQTHPAAMVVLWYAYAKRDAPLDKRFVKDMWELAELDRATNKRTPARQSALDSLRAWNAVTGSDGAARLNIVQQDRNALMPLTEENRSRFTALCTLEQALRLWASMPAIKTNEGTNDFPAVLGE